MSKLTSSWVKERWVTARQQQDLYNSRFGANVGVREFYKNENPLLRSLTKYEVTIEMKYEGDGYEFFIPQESYTIYGFESPENQRVIEENTKQSVAQIFKGKATDWVYNHVEVTTRGIERGKIKYDEVNTNKLKTSASYTDDMPKVDISKKEKGNKANKNTYNLDLWL